MSNTNIQDAYESVRKFNAIAGNLEGVTPQSINAQLDFIHEELVETSFAMGHEGCDCGQEEAAPDAIELLDGACDLFVTIAGLMQKLGAAGFDVDEALKRVCENNLSKFPLVGAGDACPVGASAHYSKYDTVVYKRDTDGKVMKPTNFVPVNINALAPGDFFA